MSKVRERSDRARARRLSNFRRNESSSSCLSTPDFGLAQHLFTLICRVLFSNFIVIVERANERSRLRIALNQISGVLKDDGDVPRRRSQAYAPAEVKRRFVLNNLSFVNSFTCYIFVKGERCKERT